MIVEEVKLPALQRVHSQVDFYSLVYAHLSEIPAGRLGLYSPGLDKTMIIKPYEWGNIWVYGMNIILAGWITRGEFLRCASAYQPKSDVLRRHRDMENTWLYPFPILSRWRAYSKGPSSGVKA
jgi:hypothetical protein